MVETVNCDDPIGLATENSLDIVANHSHRKSNTDSREAYTDRSVHRKPAAKSREAYTDTSLHRMSSTDKRGAYVNSKGYRVPKDGNHVQTLSKTVKQQIIIC